MSEAPSPEEFKRMRDEASRRAILENKKESIADLAVDPQPPGAFETGSPSSPEGQKVFRATEKASLTPPNAPSAAALMAEEALGVPIEGTIVRAAKPAIDAAKPLVEAAKPYFDSVVEGLTSMVKKTPKAADEVPKPASDMAAASKRERFDALYDHPDGAPTDLEEIIRDNKDRVGPAIAAIAVRAKNPAIARIAERIEPIVRDVPVRIIDSLDEALEPDKHGNSMAGAYGKYFPIQHSITLRGKRTYADYEDLYDKMKQEGLNRRKTYRVGSRRMSAEDVSENFAKLRKFNPGTQGGTDAEVVLHEALHAATVRRLFDGQLPANAGTALHKATQDIMQLRSEVRRAYVSLPAEKRRNFDAAMSNEREFVAYGLSDLEFQQFLKETKVPGSSQTLWSKFVSLVGRLLGIAPEDHTALGELLRATDELLEAPLSERKDSIFEAI